MGKSSKRSIRCCLGEFDTWSDGVVGLIGCPYIMLYCLVCVAPRHRDFLCALHSVLFAQCRVEI